MDGFRGLQTTVVDGLVAPVFSPVMLCLEEVGPVLG